MLKFEDQKEVVEAGQIRVSPQELSEALRAVEESKEAKARFEADTIPLGQAIEALGITYTPEEVLEALKAHRARQIPVLAQHTVSPHRRRIAGRAVLAGLLVSSAALIFLLRATGPLNPVQDAATAVTAPAAVNSGTVGFQTKRLSQIGVGEMFHCDTASLLRIAKGTASPNTVVEVGALQNDLWIGMRGPTGFEVQGWTTSADALKLANGEEASLYRSADSFSSTLPYTSVHLLLNRLNHVGSSGTDYITVQSIPGNSR